MKRYTAIVISLLLIAALFTSCSNKNKLPKIDGGEVLTNEGGETFAAVTDESGEITRSDNGDLYLIVTDANGKEVTNQNGENATEKANLEHGLVIGNKVEFDKFSVTVPDGWDATYTFTTCTLQKKGAAEGKPADTINISFSDKLTLEDGMKQTEGLFAVIEKSYQNTRRDAVGVDIQGTNAPLYGIYVPESYDGNPTYSGYIYYKIPSGMITVSVSGPRDLQKDMTEMLEILNSITYYN